MGTVTDHLEGLGVAFEVLPHVRTATALEEALALRLDPQTVLKAVLLESVAGPVVAVTSAAHRLDLDLVRETLGDPSATVAEEASVARVFPEFEPGALPALPSLLHVPVIVDPHALDHDRVTIAAGTQRGSIRLSVRDVTRSGEVTIAPIARTLLTS